MKESSDRKKKWGKNYKHDEIREKYVMEGLCKLNAMGDCRESCKHKNVFFYKKGFFHVKGD